MKGTPENTSTLSRRGFLIAIIGGFSTFVATVLGVPATLFALSPALNRRRKVDWVPVGTLSDFTIGQPKLADFTMFRKDGWLEETVSKAVWVVRTSEADFTVFNPRCTHLGCIVSWRPEEEAFVSPCHGGFFTLSGEVRAGPPPRPLDKLDWALEGDKLVVDYREFRLGISDRMEV